MALCDRAQRRRAVTLVVMHGDATPCCLQWHRSLAWTHSHRESPRTCPERGPMHLGFEGKRVLVTGSTAGIGPAAALGFSREGARIIVNGRTQTPLARAPAK